MPLTRPGFSSAVSSDRLELLSTFVQIVDRGSLSAAATQMRTTQPTISRRLQSLERLLGVRLLHRSTHAMKLTEDGERLVEHARELTKTWQAFMSEIQGDDDDPEGMLRVVVPHAFGQQLLVTPVADYLARYPRVSVEWLLHDRRPDFIAEGIDCAIQVGEVTDLGVVAIKLSEVPRIVVAAPSVLDHQPTPVHARELAALPWLTLRTFYRTEIMLAHVSNGESCRVPLRPRFATDSLYALRSAALLGMGVCVGSTWLLSEDLVQGRLVQLVPEWQAAALPVYLTYPQARLQSPKLKRFIEAMRFQWPA